MDTNGAFSVSDKVSMCNYWANRLCCEAAIVLCRCTVVWVTAASLSSIFIVTIAATALPKAPRKYRYVELPGTYLVLWVARARASRGLAFERIAQDLEQRLGELLPKVIDDCTALAKLERLSGGASQETYRITIDTPSGARQLAMRRAAG